MGLHLQANGAEERAHVRALSQGGWGDRPNAGQAAGGGRGLAWVLEQPEAAEVLSAFCKCQQVHLAHSGSRLSPPEHLSTTGAEWTSRQE